jgi:hypothetical protein
VDIPTTPCGCPCSPRSQCGPAAQDVIGAGSTQPRRTTPGAVCRVSAESQTNVMTVVSPVSPGADLPTVHPVHPVPPDARLDWLSIAGVERIVQHAGIDMADIVEVTARRSRR